MEREDRGREREILSSERKKFGRRRVALEWKPTEKNPYRCTRGGVRWSGGGATPFFGVHGGENDNWSSWQRPSHLVSILSRVFFFHPTLPRPLRNPEPRRLAISLLFLHLSLSLIARFLSFFERKGRGRGAERMALAKSRSLPFEDLPTGGHLPPSIPPLGKSERG